MKNFLLILLFSFVLSACGSETASVVDDVYKCTNVTIDSDVYTVSTIPTNDGLKVGYLRNGQFIYHSECTPSLVKSEASSTTYKYYIHGNEAEVDSVSSLTFGINSSGQETLNALRIVRNGRIIEEDGLSNNLQYLKWKESFGIVEAEDNFDFSGLKEVNVSLGDRTKLASYDYNLGIWQCWYRNNGTILEIDDNCTNEKSLDIKYLGIYVPFSDYITALSSSRTYETNQDKINNLFEIYFDVNIDNF
ncbi:hypothetical protein [Vibrio crassostreae]|uniref:hypothetical protein n=1 Tax=Vibrio crassostreae TaxID=246167 RepID=UPI001B31826A|nr:hypothetical protein [Vibrio crassostreae]